MTQTFNLLITTKVILKLNLYFLIKSILESFLYSKFITIFAIELLSFQFEQKAY